MPVLEPNRSSALWWMLLFTAAVVAVGSVFGPRPAFATLCHQLADRSFVVGDHLFAVCHRCTGLYLGFLIGILVGCVPRVRAPIGRSPLVLIAIAAVAVGFDVGLDMLRILSNTVGTRLVTGSLLGVALGVFLSVVLLDHKPTKRIPKLQDPSPQT